jgi:hypothetical protein
MLMATVHYMYSYVSNNTVYSVMHMKFEMNVQIA